MMKYLLLLSTLTLSLMFSSASSAEWTGVAKSAVSGDKYYVDIGRVRKNGGYTYFWYLNDLLKPDKFGDLSNKFYVEVDCKAFRYKTLSNIYYKQPMGEGNGESSNRDNPEWKYPPPESVIESMLQRVCAQ